MSSSQVIMVKITCAFCSTENEVCINKAELENEPSGVIRIPIEHVTPQPHLLIVDIDVHGTLRGAYIIKDYSLLEGVLMGEILDTIGISNLSKLLAWLLVYDEVDLYGRNPDVTKLISTFLSHVFGNARKISLGKEKARVRLDVSNIPEPEFSLSVINRRLQSAVKNIKSSSSLIAFLKNEFERYVTYINVFEEALKSTKRRLTMDDFIRISEGKLQRDEIKLILAVLKARGIDVSRKVEIPEFKIAELF
ncbi:MAG: hypothetical protein NDP23_06240 [Crenarchaeota archaeon]|nr:hypothetical protein [Thermoproteota archaeon]MCR8489131.1 hypothetical protein [Thermoproteota archaeon]